MWMLFILFDGQWMDLMNEWFTNVCVIYYFTWLKPILNAGKIHSIIQIFPSYLLWLWYCHLPKPFILPSPFLRLNRGGPNSKCLARSGRSCRRMPCCRAGRGRAPRASPSASSVFCLFIRLSTIPSVTLAQPRRVSSDKRRSIIFCVRFPGSDTIVARYCLLLVDLSWMCCGTTPL